MYVQVAEFFVAGIPVPQGSHKGFARPGSSFVQIVDDNKAVLKPWRAAVTAAAIEAHGGRSRVEGAVMLVLEFRFVRPKSVSVKKRPFPTVKPDASKVLRAIEDAITDSGLWRDDAQVVEAHITKVYAERPGVQVRIGEFREEGKA
jgi:crossover junction endodeoxyribonuclease RusA